MTDYTAQELQDSEQEWAAYCHDLKVWQEDAEKALQAAATRPLTPAEISLLKWCAGLT